MLALAESMSVNKPDNGWFIPNCDHVGSLLDEAHANERRVVKIQRLQGEGQVNVLQTLNNWLKTGQDHQAIDAFGLPNEACSKTKSLPLDLRPDALLPEIVDGDPQEPLRKSKIFNTKY